jgi:hypothetical protein
MSVTYEEKASRGLEQLGLKVALDHLDQASQRAAAEAWSYSHFLGYLPKGHDQKTLSLARNGRICHTNAYENINQKPYD